MYLIFKKYFLNIVPILIILFTINSCRKNDFLTSGGQLTFSVDTVLFDTVFTAQGSSTREMKIFNPQKQKIKISSISLAKGEKSPFRINVNGYNGKIVEDIEIAALDSIWLFAAVTIDPTEEDNPFIISDEILIQLNDQSFQIPVLAFGQNANYIVDSVLSTQTWTADRPYIILQNALIAPGETLTINPGTRVYVHQDSRLFVQGTLKINGTKEDSVIFQGDRIDRKIYVGDYSDIPGEWGGLYFFKESQANEINYAIFKNGGASTLLGDQAVMPATIQLDPDTILNGQPKLKITNSIIHTSQGYGILAFNSTLYAENCLIVECGAENVMFFEGGNYQLYDCTIGTYGGSYLSHAQSASLGILNYYPISQTEYIGAALKAEVVNCIIYGSLEEEVFIQKKDDFTADVTLSHSLVKSKEGIEPFTDLNQVIFNEDPLFIDRVNKDYRLESGSPAIQKGISIGIINTDLDGKARNNPPTIGCYEF